MKFHPTIVMAFVAALLFISCSKPTPLSSATPSETQVATPQTDDKAWYTQNEAQDVFDQVWNHLKTTHALFLIEPERVPQIEQTCQNQRSSIPQNGLAKDELIRTVNRCLHDFHDAHLNFFGTKLPTPEHMLLTDLIMRQLKGAKIVSFNGESIDDIFQRTETWQNYELPAYGKANIENQLFTQAAFELYGINDNDLHITLKNSDNTIETLHYTKADFNPQKVHSQKIRDLVLSINSLKSWKDIQFKTDKKLAILTLNNCRVDDESKAMLKTLFTDIKRMGIEHLIIDLRKNSGGNSAIANEIISYLNIDSYLTGSTYVREGEKLHSYINVQTPNTRKPELYEGKIYLLTSTATFSSAVIFADYFQGNHLGIVIGEIPGNARNSYGDIIQHDIQGYPLRLQSTFKYFARVNGDLTENRIIPDIECPEKDAMTEALKLVDETLKK